MMIVMRMLEGWRDKRDLNLDSVPAFFSFPPPLLFRFFVLPALFDFGLTVRTPHVSYFPNFSISLSCHMSRP